MTDVQNHIRRYLLSMGKKELKNKTLVARMSESEYQEVQDFIDMMGIDQSTLIRDSVKSHIRDFDLRYDGVELFKRKSTEYQNINFENERSLPSFQVEKDLTKAETFFKIPKITDDELKKIGSVDLELNIIDMIKLEMFIFEHLGIQGQNHINWNSPLVALLTNYHRFCLSKINMK